VAKFSRTSKLAPTKRQELIYSFCQAIQSLKTDEEVAKFITDLLSPQEIEMLAKRLQIAECLLKGEDYMQIRDQLKVGFSTIARISTWLGLSGEGFKLVLSRKKVSKKIISLAEKSDYFSQYSIKHRYPRHYLPELLIERILNVSDAAHKKKIATILQSMKVKHFI
jgi:TrpR-related protein YerC/YecD